MEAWRVGCSSVFIRFHSCKDIVNRSGCRCTKHHAGSLHRCLLVPNFLSLSRPVDEQQSNSFCYRLVLGRRLKGKEKRKSARRIWTRENEKVYWFNSSRASRVLKKIFPFMMGSFVVMEFYSCFIETLVLRPPKFHKKMTHKAVINIVKQCISKNNAGVRFSNLSFHTKIV